MYQEMLHGMIPLGSMEYLKKNWLQTLPDEDIDSTDVCRYFHCNVEPKRRRYCRCSLLSIWCREETVYPNPSTGIVTVDPGTAATKGILTGTMCWEKQSPPGRLPVMSRVFSSIMVSHPTRYYITIRQMMENAKKATYISQIMFNFTVGNYD